MQGVGQNADIRVDNGNVTYTEEHIVSEYVYMKNDVRIVGHNPQKADSSKMIMHAIFG